jgi:hypothetical protein
LLNYHEQDLTVDEHFEIRKQYALEEAKEPEPEPKARTMTVSKLTEGLGLTEAGIKVFEDTGLNEQRATTGQGIMRMLACYEGILKEKKRYYFSVRSTSNLRSTCTSCCIVSRNTSCTLGNVRGCFQGLFT